MTATPGLAFDNSYARLPPQFFTQQLPEPVSSPGLIAVNHALARQLGIDPDWLESTAGIEMVAGNHLPEGAEPIATVYAGHQFGGWNPQLGDGRAVLLGELIGADGIRYDLQLKGSGRTPYSRGGDGRAPLGPVLREYIVSEAMAALGVPTTRALAAATTGDAVMREGMLPGAVLARVAQSHIRIGTFQFFAARQDLEALRALAEHVIQRHYPNAAKTENPVLALLEGVVANQARLIARWQLLGFIHGVMNTDNMLLSGETIDYGPCAFMDNFNADTVFSSIDHGGRYAYRNQPGIAQWNLSCLAQALLPLIDEDQERAVASAQAAIDAFPDLFLEAHTRGMNKKLGLASTLAEDEVLVQDLLAVMSTAEADFTLSFRRLAELACPESGGESVTGIFELPSTFEPWLQRWRERLAQDSLDPGARQQQMLAASPVFIPRNHLVEETINAAVRDGDFEPFHKLNEVLSAPFLYQSSLARYATPPRSEQIVHQTFCGT
ncbi:MAG: YdiU family protein [Gammaproteobacteria bacterium]|nr:YdiU family protein [Gammaproteobacteria bacterium]